MDDATAPCALVVMGVSGSGKSTIADRLAARLDWRYEDGDKFHPPANVAKMSAGQPLTDEDRWPWLQAIADEIDRLSAAGQRAVIACSALKRAYRDLIRSIAGDVTFVLPLLSREQLRARMAQRANHFMPTALLDSQLQTLEAPGADENAIEVDGNLPVEEQVARVTKALGQPAPLGAPVR